MFKYYLMFVVRKMTRIFNIFPIKKNRILFSSFAGKECSDSPKYIARYLTNYFQGEYEIVWAVNEPSQFKILENKGWKFIRYKTIKYLYYSATSKYIITNMGPMKAIERRKHQEIINTWHGGGAYKKTGGDNPYKDKYKLLTNKKLGQKGVTLFLSSSQAFTKYVIRGAFGYQGKVMECGLPRNDFLLQKIDENIIKKKVRKSLNIESDSHIVLFAPTWRNYDMSGFEELNIQQVLEICKKRWGGNWIFVLRGHNLSKIAASIGNNSRIISANHYEDMQELLVAADILISDYSSCIWDFSFTEKPCFLFTPDLISYKKTFDFYMPIETWGFPVACTNVELEFCVREYNEIDYKRKIQENHEFFGNKETGEATKKICEYIRNGQENS